MTRRRKVTVWGMRGSPELEVAEDKARELLSRYDRLIVYVIRKYRYASAVPDHYWDDLVSVGQIALLQSYASWDPERASFTTWAVRRIRQALGGFVRRALSQTTNEQAALMAVTRHDRRVRRGQETEPLAKGVRDRARQVTNRRMVRLDRPLSHDSEETLRDVLLRHEPVDHVERIYWERAQRWFRTKLSNGLLTPRERAVIYGRLAGKTLREIGEDFEVSRERIRQIEAKAFKKLQTAARHAVL